jgi:hypothetical protein
VLRVPVSDVAMDALKQESKTSKLIAEVYPGKSKTSSSKVGVLKQKENGTWLTVSPPSPDCRRLIGGPQSSSEKVRGGVKDARSPPGSGSPAL